MKMKKIKIVPLEKIVCKSTVETEKIDFLKILKELQSKQHNNFSVCIIAAKIARGENVSYEELKYIRQYSPALLSEALKHNDERKEAERSEKDEIEEVAKMKPIKEYERINNYEKI